VMVPEKDVVRYWMLRQTAAEDDPLENAAVSVAVSICVKTSGAVFPSQSGPGAV